MEIHQPIQFGDLPISILEILHPEPPTPPPSQLLEPSRPPPLSPQLQLTSNPNVPKPPRNLPPLSRTASPPPPSPRSLSPTTTRSYASVPFQWNGDNKIPNQVSYLSRDTLLRKIYPRTTIYCHADTTQSGKVSREALLQMGLARLTKPVDYLITFPIQPPNVPQIGQPLPFIAMNAGQGVVHAWATGPVKTSDDTLGRWFANGVPPFPWAIKYTAPTSMLTLEDLLRRGVRVITGFVECPKCKQIIGLDYLLSERYSIVTEYLFKIKGEILGNGEKIMQNMEFPCLCDGNISRGRPVISENMRKIDWLFLFLGCGLGYCKLDQLQYYCSQRRLTTGGTKNRLLLQVVRDICKQLSPQASTIV